MVAHPPAVLGYGPRAGGRIAIKAKAAQLKQQQGADSASGWLKRLYCKARLSAGELAEGSKALLSSGGKETRRLSRLARNAPKLKVKADGLTKADDRNCSRGVTRVLKKETLLPPPLLVGIPLWHQGKNKQVVEPVAFQPIHEVLDALVVPGQEGDWLSCNSAQEDFQRRVKDWGKRVSVDDIRSVAGLQR